MSRPKKDMHIETYPDWKDIALVLGKFLGNRSYCPPGRHPKDCENPSCADCWVDWAVAEAKKDKQHG